MCFAWTLLLASYETWYRKDLWEVLLVDKLSLKSSLMVCILLWLYPMNLGLTDIYIWISWWVYLHLKGVRILYMWSLIVFLKWHILFHIIKLTMLHILLTCFSKRLWHCPACLIILFQIRMQSFFKFFFGKLRGVRYELNFCLLLLVINKLMDKS